ncbi:MAG: methylenetetrahydrofolate reductase [Deltaproteobacteria bacterium]|nr:methylenetetrahydrofolate reductase [Deltaproteobacteria bacterium]
MKLKEKINGGKFAILAEIEPPKGSDTTNMVKNATRVKGVVDAFIVPEMSNAVMRMSALGGALILQGRGMETVMQICCRDRNRLALQADILAANGCGITNIMAVTGEDTGFGDHHQARDVYDIKQIELLQAIQKLQSGRDMAGIELEGSPEFLVGSVANAGAGGKDLDREMVEMDAKIMAGCEFFIIPPVFDLGAVKPFLDRVEERNARVIPTVLLLKSLGMARYITRNMDNVHIPNEIIKRIQKAPDKARECVHLASEMVAAIKKAGFPGVNLVTIGWEKKIPEILGGMGV